MMFNFINHQENANYNHNAILLHTHRMSKTQSRQCWMLIRTLTAGANVSWYMLKNCVALSTKAKYTHTLRSCNSTLTYMYKFPKRYSIICYNSIISNSPNWKQHKCLSTEVWINDLCYIHTREHYTTVKMIRD